jgi:two-component system cell cycle response regulator DivK
MAKRILVAENDKLNMRLFRDVLTNQGYETIEAEDGLAALAAAQSDAPDLILADMQLPGLSGVELTGRLKADPALARVPVIAVTAFVGRADEARIRAAGVDDFVTKPVAPSRLIAAVERNLAKNGNGLAAEDRPKPWTIVEDFRAPPIRDAQAERMVELVPDVEAAPDVPPAPEPSIEPAPEPGPPPSAAEASQLLGTALAFTGAFLAVALSPAAGGLEGLANLYVVHFPNGAAGLCPGRPVAWQRQVVGRVWRVEIDRDLAGGVQAVLQIDRMPAGVGEMTAVLRHENIVGDAYVELRASTAAGGRLDAHANRAATTLRAISSEMARDIENLPRWFDRAAAMVEGAAHLMDRRDTAALARAVTRIAALMDGIGASARGLDEASRANWIEDVSQILAESRDLFGLLRQIGERIEKG